jgi:hypothetical protein
MGDALECAQTMSRAVTLTVAQAELLVKDDMRELSLRGANDDATQTWDSQQDSQRCVSNKKQHWFLVSLYRW